MAKELTFSEATLGWRFAHTEIFLKHFIKQWELLQDVQIKNLDEYWNINAASGTWLNQLGEIFDTARVQTLGENAFMLNVSRLNDPDSRLNGKIEDVADELFRKIVLLRALSVNKLFSMKNIAEDLYEVFGRDQIKVEFRENTDDFGNYKAQYFRILLTFKDSEMIRMFGGMQKTHPMLFIGKPMGVGYHIYISYDPNLGINTPQTQPQPEPEPNTPTEPDTPTEPEGIGVAVLRSAGGSALPLLQSFDGTLESMSDYEEEINPWRLVYVGLPIAPQTRVNVYADQQLTEIIGQYAIIYNNFGLYTYNENGNKFAAGRFYTNEAPKGFNRTIIVREIN